MNTESKAIEEIEIRNGRFYTLENKADGKKYLYPDIKPAINRIKELIITVDSDKLLLSTVEIIEKNWNITGVPWSIIAMGLMRGDIDDEIIKSIAGGGGEKRRI